MRVDYILAGMATFCIAALVIADWYTVVQAWAALAESVKRRG
jgi:hypothetical protein